MDHSTTNIVGVHHDEDLATLLGDLPAQARAEGFGMLDRLVADWRSGANRFNGTGEWLFVAAHAGEPVGVAGLNVDPFAGDARVGRVRRLYVAPAARRGGLGTLLLNAVLDGARFGGFEAVHLRTTTKRGSAFFEACGFEPVELPDTTHRFGRTL